MRATIAIVVLVVAVGAIAEEPETITLCDSSTRDELEAAELLNTWLRSSRVRVDNCAASDRGKRLTFLERGTTVILRLETADTARDRDVPWIDRTDAPLSRLRAAEALTKLSVLVEAMLDEERLNAGGSSQPGPPVEASAPARLHRREQPSTAESSAKETPAAKPDGEQQSLTEPVPPVAAAAPEAASSVPPTTHGESGWSLALGAAGGGRVRAPNIVTPELVVSLGWGPFVVAPSWDPRSVFSFGGTPVAIAGIGLDAGARFELFRTGWWSLGWDAEVHGEWLSLRRLDVNAAAAARYGDLGVGAGLWVAVALGSLQIPLRLGGLFLPTGRLVEIPAGPQERVGLWSLQASLGLCWHP